MSSVSTSAGNGSTDGSAEVATGTAVGGRAATADGTDSTDMHAYRHTGSTW